MSKYDMICNDMASVKYNRINPIWSETHFAYVWGICMSQANLDRFIKSAVELNWKKLTYESLYRSMIKGSFVEKLRVTDFHITSHY